MWRGLWRRDDIWAGGALLKLKFIFRFGEAEGVVPACSAVRSPAAGRAYLLAWRRVPARLWAAGGGGLLLPPSCEERPPICRSTNGGGFDLRLLKASWRRRGLESVVTLGFRCHPLFIEWRPPPLRHVTAQPLWEDGGRVRLSSGSADFRSRYPDPNSFFSEL